MRQVLNASPRNTHVLVRGPGGSAAFGGIALAIDLIDHVFLDIIVLRSVAEIRIARGTVLEERRVTIGSGFCTEHLRYLVLRERLRRA
jgi:hypothetical protein